MTEVNMSEPQPPPEPISPPEGANPAGSVSGRQMQQPAERDVPVAPPSLDVLAEGLVRSDPTLPSSPEPIRSDPTLTVPFSHDVLTQPLSSESSSSHEDQPVSPEIADQVVSHLKEMGAQLKEGARSEDVVAAVKVYANYQDASPEAIVAAAETLGQNPWEVHDDLARKDPEKATALKKVLEEKGIKPAKDEEGQEGPKEEKNDEAERTQEEQAQTQQGKFDELIAQVKDAQGLNLGDPADRERAKALIVQGRASLLDFMQSDLWKKISHSKPYRFTKSGLKGLSFAAFFLMIALAAMEINLLVAIGKGGK